MLYQKLLSAFIGDYKSLEKYNLEIGKDNMSIDYKYNVQAKQTGITNLLQDLKDAGLKLKDLKTEQST